MSINRVTISGHLTRDPELRQTKGGTSILSFGVAVNDRRKNPQSGEWEDVPNFVDCSLFESGLTRSRQSCTRARRWPWTANSATAHGGEGRPEAKQA